MREGRDVVRVFDKNTLKWTTLPGVKLSEYRWYPTQVGTSRAEQLLGCSGPCTFCQGGSPPFAPRPARATLPRPPPKPNQPPR
jgi:hypothetical protein